MKFTIKYHCKPTGDQPQAIEKLGSNINKIKQYQTLLEVTGSGKTFTVANVIEEIQRPTLILVHNKTLAAQLYSEFKLFIPLIATRNIVLEPFYQLNFIKTAATQIGPEFDKDYGVHWYQLLNVVIWMVLFLCLSLAILKIERFVMF